MGNLPLPSVLLANIQPSDNKIDKHAYPTNGTLKIVIVIVCFTESWLNDDMNNIQLVGLKLFLQVRTVASGKTRGGSLCIFCKQQLVDDI